MRNSNAQFVLTFEQSVPQYPFLQATALHAPVALLHVTVLDVLVSGAQFALHICPQFVPHRPVLHVIQAPVCNNSHKVSQILSK